jgi:hypothetical protein
VDLLSLFTANDITDLSVPEDFFESKVDKIKKRKSEKKVKPRQCVSKLTSEDFRWLCSETTDNISVCRKNPSKLKARNQILNTECFVVHLATDFTNVIC